MSGAATGLVNGTLPAVTSNGTLPAAFGNGTLPFGAEHATNATNALNGGTAGASTVLPPSVEFSWSGYFEAIGIMLLLLAALWGVLWLIRKYAKFRFIPAPGSFPRNGLRIESQLPLGPRKGLFVVRFLNERLLLGVTDQSITLLQATPLHATEPDAPESNPPVCGKHNPDRHSVYPVNPDDAETFARLLVAEQALGNHPSEDNESHKGTPDELPRKP